MNKPIKWEHWSSVGIFDLQAEHVSLMIYDHSVFKRYQLKGNTVGLITSHCYDQGSLLYACGPASRDWWKSSLKTKIRVLLYRVIVFECTLQDMLTAKNSQLFVMNTLSKTRILD